MKIKLDDEAYEFDENSNIIEEIFDSQYDAIDYLWRGEDD